MEPPRRKKGSSADSFGTFLETVQRSVPQEQGGGAAAAVTTILGTHGPQQLSELQLKTGLSFADFAPALTALRDSGMVTVAGEPGREVVALAEGKR